MKTALFWTAGIAASMIAGRVLGLYVFTHLIAK